MNTNLNHNAQRELADIYSEISAIEKEISEKLLRKSLLEQQIAMIYTQRYNHGCGDPTTSNNQSLDSPLKSEVVVDNSLECLFGDKENKNVFNSPENNDESKEYTLTDIKKLCSSLVMDGKADQVKSVFLRHNINSVKNTPLELVNTVYKELSNIHR